MVGGGGGRGEETVAFSTKITLLQLFKTSKLISYKTYIQYIIVLEGLMVCRQEKGLDH